MQAVKNKMSQRSTVCLDMAYQCPPSEDIIPLVESALPGTTRNVELRVYASKATYSALAGRTTVTPAKTAKETKVKEKFDPRSDADISRDFAKCLHDGGERWVAMPTKKYPNGMFVTWKDSVKMRITCQLKGGEQFKQLFEMTRTDRSTN